MYSEKYAPTASAAKNTSSTFGIGFLIGCIKYLEHKYF